MSLSGTVRNNQLTGAFGYGMAISSATNFTVENNVLTGNTSFIGSKGPNCSSVDTTPTTQDFVVDESLVKSSNIQSDFQSIPDGNALTCIVPPDGGDYWPFGGNPASANSSSMTPPVSPPEAAPASGHSSTGRTIGLVVGIILGVVAAAVAAWFVRRWALARNSRVQGVGGTRDGYVQKF